MRLIRKGKVKDIYELDNGDLLFHFSDRVSAFDVAMENPIPLKGMVLCKFAEFWFSTLNIPNHMLRIVDSDKMVVRRLTMIPIECVVRGYYYGSIVDRSESEKPARLKNLKSAILASKLDEPVFDPTTKSEDHDLPINRSFAVATLGIAPNLYDRLENVSLALYREMSSVVSRAGFIMADVKFEFGVDASGTLLLADSLGPDEFRLWRSDEYSPGKIQESYDKQILRDWLKKTGFKSEVDALAAQGKKPRPPIIPEELVQKLSERYIAAYERITGHSL